jgi:hypothetical protein
MPPWLVIKDKNGNPIPTRPKKLTRRQELEQEEKEAKERLELAELEERVLLMKQKASQAEARVAKLKAPKAPVRGTSEKKESEEKESEASSSVSSSVSSSSSSKKPMVLGNKKVSEKWGGRSITYDVNDFALSDSSIDAIAHELLRVYNANNALKDRQMRIDFRSEGLGDGHTDLTLVQAGKDITLDHVKAKLGKLLGDKMASSSGGEWLVINITLKGVV